MPYVTVIIYHNVEKDEQGRRLGFMGYKPGHAVTPVFTFALELLVASGVEQAEQVYAIANSYPGAMHCANEFTPIVNRYRANRLRSLSVGDVIQIGRCGAYAVEAVGFKPVSTALNVSENIDDHFVDPPWWEYR